jgi:hypothetical protein
VNLWPLFFVSLASVGYETALIRFFAVATWSEYGYWVISIVMAGFALSGVVLALWRDVFARNGDRLLAVLPPILVVTAALGFHFVTVNPFNPLQLQNPTTWTSQIWNIAGYYAALLPFFFLAGLFVSLSFVLNARRVGRVYAFDLTGAAAGAAGILLAMFFVHAFFLVPLLLLSLAAAASCGPRRWRMRSTNLAMLALLAGAALLVFDNQARISEFKPVYAPLHTPNARVVATLLSPRGDYTLLDDFTERVDTDISNNAGLLHVPGPPRSFGLYRDGTRIAALPFPPGPSAAYARSALDALPYTLMAHPNTLLIGASGGFRIAEVLELGAARVRVLEPEPTLLHALHDGMGPSPPWHPDPRAVLSGASPLAAVRSTQRYDVIDVSADFLDAAEANVIAFSVQAIADDLHALTPDGIVSVPVSIRDFPVYALRVLATARAALLRDGVYDPAAHVVVYRSAWSARVLLSRERWSAARIATVRKFCDDRSFDVSWYPGIDVRAARPGIYNDLPAVSFATGEIAAASPDDSIADEAGAVLAGRPSASRTSFSLAPVTLDRPYFYAVLRLGQMSTLLRRLEVLPQAEIGALVNLAVLAQAAVIALVVLAAGFTSGAKRERSVGSRRELIRSAGGEGPIARETLSCTISLPAPVSRARVALYFSALGLGFLFIEIALIEHASLWLNSRTSGFALVLTGMLFFSGLGSLASDRLTMPNRRWLTLACLAVLLWCAAEIVGIQPAMLATLNWPWPLRWALVLAVLAPVSLALGLPFPLGLACLGQNSSALPWAWGLNGAFSVVASPVANLIAREWGLNRLLLYAAAMYALVLASYPAKQRGVRR